MRKVLNGQHEFSDVTFPDGTCVEDPRQDQVDAFLKEFEGPYGAEFLRKLGNTPMLLGGKIRWCKVRNV